MTQPRVPHKSKSESEAALYVQGMRELHVSLQQTPSFSLLIAQAATVCFFITPLIGLSTPRPAPFTYLH